MSTKKLNLHFIGIGGIGVSALAKYYLEKGCQVTGSDLVSSEITEALRKKGAKISIGKHKAKNVLPDVDLIVYSPAVQPTNPELEAARKKGIKCLSYPQALGKLTKKSFTIAVSGTHGKSTTASMIGLLLVKAGLDPTVIVGTRLKEFGDSNCRVGKSKYLVIEADEHFASFLNYWPKIIVITNIEADHLDYYRNLRNLKKAFNEFINHLPKNGVLITNKSVGSLSPHLISCRTRLRFVRHKKAFPKLKKILKVPGAHNIYNASLALAVARVLKIPDKVSFKALADYKGSWRRFEIIEADLRRLQCRFRRKIIIVSDYGHHPTEIKVTLKAAREKWPKKKIWCVYQPHQYQRTYYLFNDFVKVFREALRPGHSAELSQSPQGKSRVDKLIITDIYDVAGREEKEIKKKISSEKLIKTIKKPWAIYLKKDEILDHLKKNLKGGEIVIIMGAGDIYNLTLNLTKMAKGKKIK